MNGFAYLLLGLSLGISAAASPGPFQAYVIGVSLRSGWQRAWTAAFAPLLSDGPIIALILLVLTRMPAEFLRIIQIVGGLFVLWLAWKGWQAYLNFRPEGLISGTEVKKNLLQATLMNFLSPGPYLFWSLMAGPTLLRGWKQSPLMGISFLSGFYIALIGGMLLLIVLFGMARNLGPRANRGLLGISALALLLFGMYQLWSGFFVA